MAEFYDFACDVYGFVMRHRVNYRTTFFIVQTQFSVSISVQKKNQKPCRSPICMRCCKWRSVSTRESSLFEDPSCFSSTKVKTWQDGVMNLMSLWRPRLQSFSMGPGRDPVLKRGNSKKISQEWKDNVFGTGESRSRIRGRSTRLVERNRSGAMSDGIFDFWKQKARERGDWRNEDGKTSHVASAEGSVVS